MAKKAKSSHIPTPDFGNDKTQTDNTAIIKAQNALDAAKKVIADATSTTTTLKWELKTTKGSLNTGESGGSTGDYTTGYQQGSVKAWQKRYEKDKAALPTWENVHDNLSDTAAHNFYLAASDLALKILADMSYAEQMCKAAIAAANTATDSLPGLQKALDAANAGKSKPYVAPKSPKDKSNNGGGQGPAIPQWIYNPPMVNSSYFGADSLQASTTDTGVVGSPASTKNAKYDWSKGSSAKGSLQMSRSFAYKNTTTQKQVNDIKLYGFRFLYNPTTVDMGWGVSTQVNWDYEALGKDKASAIAMGILQSTITFNLVLNRIQDLSVIEASKTDATTGASTELTISSNDAGVFPWSTTHTLTSEDVVGLYQKGTMYDMEFFFRTVMGLNADYQSTLNGKTADRGWLNAVPIELHLGDGLHYLVRVTSLDVNHTIFNDRMVPILSQVSITCARYYDGPDLSSSQVVTTNS